jgi:hypothetical protein
MWFTLEQMMCHAHLTQLQIHLGRKGSPLDGAAQNRRSLRFCVQVMADPGCPRCLEDSFCSALDYIYAISNHHRIKKK